MRKLFLSLLLVLVTALPANAWLNDGYGGGGSSGGGGGSGDITAVNSGEGTHGGGVTGAVTIDAPGNLEFDCTVDDSGGQDYATINQAWTAGCRKMFIYNGSYSMASQIVIDDPTTEVWVIGESRNGVVIDLNQLDPIFQFNDTTRPNPSYTTETIANTLNSKTVTSDGTPDTQFSTWGVTAGMFFFPYAGSAAGLSGEFGYEIESVDSETQLTLKQEWHNPSTTTNNDFAFYDPYRNVRFENLTFTNTTSVGTDRVIRAPNTFFVNSIFRNLRLEQLTRLFYDYHIAANSWVENIEDNHSSGRIYSGPETVVIGATKADTLSGGDPDEPPVILGGRAYGSSFDYMKGFGVTFGYTATGRNFITSGSFGAGNTVKGGAPLIESLYDSLHLPGYLLVDGEPALRLGATLNNLALGEDAGTQTFATGSTDARNVFVGQGAGWGSGVTVSTDNVGVGVDALGSIEDGDFNTALGDQVLESLTSGADNTGVGASALSGIDTGSNNVGVGTLSLSLLSSQSDNTGLGYQSGRYILGTGNIALGFNSLYSTNTADIADYNTSIGHGTGTAVTSGDSNLFIGARAGDTINTGSDNVILGTDGGNTLGGASAGMVIIGDSAGPATPGVYSNELYIHNSETDTPLIWGDFTTREVRINGSLVVPGGSESDFDCTVDDSGEATYTTINAAWTGGCRKMFLFDGTHTVTAQINATTPEEIWLIGESRDGTIIDTNNFDVFDLGDSSAPSYIGTGTFSIAEGSNAVTGVGTSFLTWAEVGDTFCPNYNGTSPYDICYPIQAIGSDTSMTLSRYYKGPAHSGTSMQSYTIVGAPYTFVIKNLSAQNNASTFTDRLMANPSVLEPVINMTVENVRLPSSATTGDVRLEYDGYLSTDISLWSRILAEHNYEDAYRGGAGLVINSDFSDHYLYTHNMTAFSQVRSVGTYNKGTPGDLKTGMIFTGNLVSGQGVSGLDMVTADAVIGNIDVEGNPMLEQVYDSLNLPGYLLVDGEPALRLDGTLNNLAVGEDAGTQTFATGSTDARNVFVGQGAGWGTGTTVSTDNVGVGVDALGSIEDGDNNAAFGDQALDSLTAGSNNTAVGSGAGASIVAGSGNVLVGDSAGPTTDQSNQLFIHNTTDNDPLIWGDFSTGEVKVSGNGSLATFTLASNDLSIIDNNSIGYIDWLSDDTDAPLARTARIRAVSAEAFTSATNVGTQLEFFTVPVGSGTLTHQVQITADGVLYAGGVNTPTWDSGTKLAVDGDLEALNTAGAASSLHLTLQDLSILNGNPLGWIEFEGHDTDAPDGIGAQIVGKAGGDWTGVADTPGYLEFYTTPDGSGTPTLALTIGSNQVSTFSGNVQFDSSAEFADDTSLGLGVTSEFVLRYDTNGSGDAIGVMQIKRLAAGDTAGVFIASDNIPNNDAAHDDYLSPTFIFANEEGADTSDYAAVVIGPRTTANVAVDHYFDFFAMTGALDNTPNATTTEKPPNFRFGDTGTGTFSSADGEGGDVLFEDEVEFDSPVYAEAVNAAGGSADTLTIRGTLGIMDGSDAYSALLLDIVNPDHTGANNYVTAIEIDTITGDANATERAVYINSGWDTGITTLAPIHLWDEVTLQFGAQSDIQVSYDEATDDRLEFTDGTNLLMALVDAGTTGQLTVTGGIFPLASVNMLDNQNINYGTQQDIRVTYDESGEDRLEWHDGTNLLMYLVDSGTVGTLGITGDINILDNNNMRYGTGNDIQVRYDETTDDRLEWHDGTNLLMALKDKGNGAEMDLTVDSTAATSSDTLTISGTVGIMDGSDTYRAIFIDPINADHTGASNTIVGLDIDNVVGDIDALEYGIRVSSGWDYGLTTLSDIRLLDNVDIAYGNSADIQATYDAAGDNRLEWHDGTNLLMSLTDSGTSGLLGNTRLDDDSVTIVDSADVTKQLEVEVSGITTATTRTVTAQDRDGIMVLHSLKESKSALTDAGSNNLFQMTCADNSYCEGRIDYTIIAHDGTERQVHSGFLIVTGSNDSTTLDCQESHTGSSLHDSSVTTGTLTDSWSATSGTDLCTISVTPTSSLTTTDITIYYEVNSVMNSTFTAL